MAESDFSIAVFPFLKTSEPVQLGRTLFRSTLDIEGLTLEQALAVREISAMLFLKDDLRVVSATYAVVPFIDQNYPGPALDRLAELRSIISYAYFSPHDTQDAAFLPPENASLAVFSPSDVSEFLVRPHYHTMSVRTSPSLAPDAHHRLRGYSGRYNFTQPFWVEPGSRLYGPTPNLGLNISQNLAYDIEWLCGDSRALPRLLKLLEAPPSAVRERVFTALRWFNSANEVVASPDRALLDLAIAFEALFALPTDAKTERLVDAITLLLGRTERLDSWVRQFYAARSSVAHEGLTRERYFYPSGKATEGKGVGRYGSLLFFGRRIFQLALSTFLFGADLATSAGLHERFVPNAERFSRIKDILRSDTDDPVDRLLAIEGLVAGVQRFRYVASDAVSTESMLGAIRAAATTAVACGLPLEQDLQEALSKLGAVSRSEGEFASLSALENLHRAFERTDRQTLTPEMLVVFELADAVWNELFMRYYALKSAVDNTA